LDRAPEVVWCDRIDPCRARIASVPLPASGRRHGDLVLHDGEPRGTRPLGDQTVSVFDELELLERSAFGTWQVTIDCSSTEELAGWISELEGESLVVEDWTESVQALCAACSLGQPHDAHEHAGPGAVCQRRRRLGVAARSAGDLAPLRQFRLWWRKGVVSVEQVL
jgi:hypothetical protein